MNDFSWRWVVLNLDSMFYPRTIYGDCEFCTISMRFIYWIFYRFIHTCRQQNFIHMHMMTCISKFNDAVFLHIYAYTLYILIHCKFVLNNVFDISCIWLSPKILKSKIGIHFGGILNVKNNQHFIWVNIMYAYIPVLIFIYCYP